MKIKMFELPLAFVLLGATPVHPAAGQTAPTVMVGVAKVDITPELPIWLAGYSSRSSEAVRGETRLFARALALGADRESPAVLITVELIGIGEETRNVVLDSLRTKHAIDPARLAICATHVHSGPALADVTPFGFSKDIPSEERERIVRYTATLRIKLAQVAERALADRKPARLAWSEGKTDFAAQRRTLVNGKWRGFGVVPEGPVDHALPLLRAVDERGALRAVFVSYACHCTTIGATDNFVHHDWAGHAAQQVEAVHTGAVALVALGCGADANPNPRGAVDMVAAHGEKVSAEIERLLAGPLRALGPVTGAKILRTELALDHAVTREELQPRVKSTRPTVAYAAGKFLERLDAGRETPTAVPYLVQAWTFGSELAMVFLAGEVVSEYSLRLRRELDGSRLWVNAFANDMPCYIPSRRMFAEGGYEVDASMDYYGWPTRLAIGTEDHIIATVRQAVPAAFVRKQPL